MSRRKEEKFVTFKEQQHKDYIKEVFTTLLITGCFMFLTIPVFGVYTSAVSLPTNNLTDCLKITANLLYAGVGLFVPFLIYSTIKYKSVGKYIKGVETSAHPLHFILGIIGGLGITFSFHALGKLAVSALRNAGITVNEAVPFTGDNLTTQIFFIIAATFIPPFFQEISFRGIVIGDVRKKSYFFAVLISALFNGLCFKSLQQIPYFLVLGLFLGVLYLKTDSVILTYTVNAFSHFSMASLWVLKLHNENFYNRIFPFLAVGGAIAAVISVIILFAVYGRTKRKEDEGVPLKKGDACKAFFGSFALWIFIIFAAVFVLLGQNGKPYLFKEIEDDTEQTTEESITLPSDTNEITTSPSEQTSSDR